MKIIHILVFGMLVVANMSCRQSASTVMLYNIDKEREFVNPSSNDRKYLIKNFDLLHITINSGNIDISNSFNARSNIQYNTSQKSSGGQANVTQVGGSFYFNAYTVDKFGFIELPLLGKVNVSGKSMEEVRLYIQDELRKTIDDVIVELKFVSFRITMQGEVSIKGIMNIYEDRINIFEAIALAGGLTEYAKVDQVILIRPTPQGSKAIPLDLTDKKILESEYFYLQPNDMIFVKPINAKLRKLNFSDYSMLLSVMSTTITTIVLITNMNK